MPRVRPPEIERNHEMPAYFQIKSWLQSEIRLGHFTGGQAIPSEPELARSFKVSRMTARQAVGELVAEGTLRRERGRGTFVAERTPFNRLLGESPLSLFESVAGQGKQLLSVVRRQEIVAAEPGVAQWLALSPGSPVLQIERLRFVDGVALCYQTSWLPAGRCPGLESIDLRTLSLSRLLRERFSLVVSGCRQLITAANASRLDAELLGVRIGSALLAVDKVTVAPDGTPVEYVHSVYPPDRYIISTRTP